MIIHSVLLGFVNYGLDDYIVKSVKNNHNKVQKEILVHPKSGHDFYRHQEVNADDSKKENVERSKIKEGSNKTKQKKLKQKTQPHPSDPNKSIPANIPETLKKEVIPGVCLVELIGKHPDDTHLESLFHSLYTERLIGKKTGDGKTIVSIDFTHFPERLEKRGYWLVRAKSEYAKHFRGKDPDKAIKHLSKDLQKEIRSLTPEQKTTVADSVYKALCHPLFTLKGSSTLTPQGSAVYVTKECVVMTINLPNNECVVKTFIPTRESYKKAIERGWDGSITLEEFNKKEANN